MPAKMEPPWENHSGQIQHGKLSCPSPKPIVTFTSKGRLDPLLKERWGGSGPEAQRNLHYLSVSLCWQHIRSFLDVSWQFPSPGGLTQFWSAVEYLKQRLPLSGRAPASFSPFCVWDLSCVIISACFLFLFSFLTCCLCVPSRQVFAVL